MQTSEPDDYDDAPLTDEAEAFIAQFERREEQGLGNFPFKGGLEPFTKTNDPTANYTVADIREVCRIVASWYVKKANWYHDVTNLQVKYQPHDIKQVIVHRMREVFPLWKPSEQTWRDFFKLLLDPPVNKLDPELSIPVWSGKRICLPGNRQRIVFRDGTATVNIWEYPRYRIRTPKGSTSFDAFLQYVIPREAEREIFLNWLAWTLQYESKKPSWAVMLYSNKQGTGKSTLTDVLKGLFGQQNTGRTNGVGKLVGRFNKEVLENKLVIVEEVEVKRGSPQANSLKSLITEESTMVEAKGLPAYVEQIYCAFVMTTNHLPLWLEESDRRFFILDFDHNGYTNGGTDYETFTRLVSHVKDDMKDPEKVKGLYESLMQRDVPAGYGYKLDIAGSSTEIMRQLKDLSPDVAKQLVEEVLANHHIVFVPVSLASKVIGRFAPREVTAQTHLFHELGWKKQKFAWDGGSQQWAWVKYIDPSKPPSRGKIYCGEPSMTSKGQERGWSKMGDQVDKLLAFLGRLSDEDPANQTPDPDPEVRRITDED